MPADARAKIWARADDDHGSYEIGNDHLTFGLDTDAGGLLRLTRLTCATQGWDPHPSPVFGSSDGALSYEICQVQGQTLVEPSGE